MSPVLEEALREWLKNPCREHGLCMFVGVYELGKGSKTGKIMGELVGLFTKGGLHHRTPFNASEGAYNYEQTLKVCHLNPKRIAWVKAKLGVSNESKT